MIPIILIGFITIVSIIGALAMVLAAIHKDVEIIFGAAFTSIAVCLIPCLFLMSVITTHSVDLSNVRNGDAFIQIKEMAIKDIDRQITELSKFKYDTALLNADSPIASLVAAKSEFVRELSNERSAVLRAKAAIDAREIGLMGAIVDWYGKE